MVNLADEDLPRMAQLVRQYAGFPLGGTDAAVIAVAERLGITQSRRSIDGISPPYGHGI